MRRARKGLIWFLRDLLGETRTRKIWVMTKKKSPVYQVGYIDAMEHMEKQIEEAIMEYKKRTGK